MLIRITYFLQTGPSHKTLVMLIQMLDKLTYPLKSEYLSYLAIHITLPLFSNSPPNRENTFVSDHHMHYSITSHTSWFNINSNTISYCILMDWTHILPKKQQNQRKCFNGYNYLFTWMISSIFSILCITSVHSANIPLTKYISVNTLNLQKGLLPVF